MLGVKGVGKGLGVIFSRLLELSLQSNLLSIFRELCEIKFAHILSL